MYSMQICFGLVHFKWKIRVPTCQGKVREKWNFAKVGDMSGNFDECQGNLKNKAKVREMSGNFEQTVREFSSICVPVFSKLIKADSYV